jgi:hypothetical protein
MILDVDRDRVIVAQTNPPLRKSQILDKIEASVVHCDLATREISRWGWTSAILALDNNYKLDPDDNSASKTTPVFIISHPGRVNLYKSNVRQAYRLETGQQSGIEVTVNPMPAPVRLINFSTGGFMLIASKPKAYTLGQELSFKLTFPEYEHLPVHHLKGQAVIVRLELSEKNMEVFLGLKFQRLDAESLLALPKIVNHYMLAEQRRYHKMDDYD